MTPQSRGTPVTPDAPDLEGSDSDAAFAAEMTNRQFTALRRHLNKATIGSELRSLLPSPRSLSVDVQSEIRKWLTNGWNTERLMRLCEAQFDDDALLYALHWAFPQAYYAVYASLMAYLKASGATESTHAAVLKKHGALIAGACYPKTLSPYAHGSKLASKYENVARYEMRSTLQLDENPQTCETQICQLLNATRQLALSERRRAMRKEFRTTRNKPKKALTKADWQRVAQAEGGTTILHFLYRKRIKANYRDIETYLHEVINSRLVVEGLVHIVSCYSFVHEAFLWAIVGDDPFRAWIASASRGDVFLNQRLETIRNL